MTLPPTAVDPYTAGDDELAVALGDVPAYRVRQLRRWLAKGVDDPAEMRDLPAALRTVAAQALVPPARVLAHTTADGGLTRKVLLELPAADAEGQAPPVEAVLMLYPRAPGRPHGRATVCVSTQAGCAMGCPFCATGQAGLRGQLSVGQIVRQVTVVQRLLQRGGDLPGGPAAGALPRDIPQGVTNVVFMGMGEPLANADATLDAVRWLTAGPPGFGLSARSVTVSTVGLVPGMRRLARLGLPVRLAVSLHAPDDALRDDLVPVNRTHPIAEVLEAADDHRRRTGRRVTFEYVLIDGVNDGAEHARLLARLLRDRAPSHINLIPMNPTPGVPWTAPPVPRQRRFAGILTRAGLPATIRANRGNDIDAACGQLYASYRLSSGRTLPLAVGAAGRVDERSRAGGAA